MFFDVLTPKSNVIKGLIYNPCTSSLLIKFVAGTVYLYSDVPIHIFNSLVNHSSKGEYFNAHIRGNFGGIKLLALS
jgi:hypothetical protein